MTTQTLVTDPARNSQAHELLERIDAGAYVPDQGAVGFTMSDGSAVTYTRHAGWIVSTCVAKCRCRLGMALYRAAKRGTV